eukprot:3703775-Rhodomonas_salina.1
MHAMCAALDGPSARRHQREWNAVRLVRELCGAGRDAGAQPAGAPRGDAHHQGSAVRSPPPRNQRHNTAFAVQRAAGMRQRAFDLAACLPALARCDALLRAEEADWDMVVGGCREVLERILEVASRSEPRLPLRLPLCVVRCRGCSQ